MSSRKKHTWVLLFCVAALIILIFFEPSYGWRLRAWLGPKNVVATDSPTLAAQNEALQAELADLKGIEAQLPQNPHNEIRAMVYSEYPFGFKNEILINAGSQDGVAVGKAVTFQGILVGSIEKVYGDSAVVQTVFDPDFKLPVRIGTRGYDALLIGGAYPKASSIAKDAAIAGGDIVYAAAPSLPYGLPVGVLDATSTSADRLFEEASLSFAYDLNGIQTVLVAR